MTIGVLKEPAHETRVSLLPDAVSALVKTGIRVDVETGAGERSFASDDEYIKAGASIRSRDETIVTADIICSIQLPELPLALNANNKVFIGIYQPLYNRERMADWARSGVTLFSLDMLPRTSRAQSMDVLSSQANIAGYKAVILAANTYSRYLPMLMTAAGSIKPAKVLILGAGVAGLQAVATAKRLGAIVEVFDTRPAVKEEVMSLGAKFIEVEGAADPTLAGGYGVEQTEEYKKRQHERIAETIAKADIVITTAQIPGKKAPILVTEEMIRTMRSGSVIVDLAAGSGGNTPFTKADETVVVNEVTIIGEGNLPASMPSDASKMYGKNIQNFLQLITSKEGQLDLNWNDDIVKGSCIAHEGKIVHERLQTETTRS